MRNTDEQAIRIVGQGSCQGCCGGLLIAAWPSLISSSKRLLLRDTTTTYQHGPPLAGGLECLGLSIKVLENACESTQAAAQAGGAARHEAQRKPHLWGRSGSNTLCTAASGSCSKVRRARKA